MASVRPGEGAARSRSRTAVDDKRLLAFDVARTFFSVLTANELLAAAERGQQSARANLVDTEARVAARPPQHGGLVTRTPAEELKRATDRTQLKQSVPWRLPLALLLSSHAGVAAFVALRCYPSTQDGPSHLYAAHVLRALQRGEPGPSAHYFAPNLGIWGNTLFFHAARLSDGWLGLERLASLFTFVALVLLPLGVYAFARALQSTAVLPPRTSPALASAVSIPLAYNYFLYRGLFNFAVAVPLAMLSLSALLTAHLPRTLVRRLLLIEAALVLAFLTALAHPAAAWFLAGAALCAAVFAPWLQRVHAVAGLAVVAAVSAGAPVLQSGPQQMQFSGPAESVMRFFRALGVTNGYWELLFVLAIVVTVLQGALRAVAALGRPRSLPDVREVWLRAWPLIAAAALLLAYPFVPFEYGALAGLNERIPPFVVLLTVPYVIDGELVRRVTCGALALFALSTITVAAERETRLANIRTQMERMELPPGSVILPVTFDLKLGSVSADLGMHLWADIARRKNLVIGDVFCSHPAHPIRCLSTLPRYDVSAIQPYLWSSQGERRMRLADPDSPIRRTLRQIARDAAFADYLTVLEPATPDPDLHEGLVHHVLGPLGAQQVSGSERVSVYALPHRRSEVARR